MIAQISQAMKPKQQVIQVKQFDKEMPIEFFRIENSFDLYDYNQHYQYDFYQIYWFTHSDHHQHEIDFITNTIEANQIWIIYPGQVHYLDPNPVKGYYLAINKDYFHRILFKEAKLEAFVGNSPLKFQVTNAMQPLFEHLHLLMEIEFSNRKRVSVLEKYLRLYLIHLQDLPFLTSDKTITIDERTHKLLSLIEEHYITQRKSQFYADSIALSTKRMNEILLLNIGKSLKQQLQDRLLLEAKRLVGYGDENIQDIAYKLHFSEVSYFNRFFKKLTGKTPLDFRMDRKKVQE